jgi:hypothetical protein
MKWFRKDNSYLWVRSELEHANPIADAMERITRYYRADRHAFEAALCASHPGRAKRIIRDFESMRKICFLCAGLNPRQFVPAEKVA